MASRCAAAFTLAAALSVSAESLPGFRAELLGPAAGFLTSIAVDSRGRLYYTTQGGSIYRLEDARSIRVAAVTTSGRNDSGLLGMALLDDDTAAVHYTVPAANPELVAYDVVSTIDLRTGREVLLHEFACDVEVPARGASAEHHGGNPVPAGDGSLFVGIGDYNGRVLARLPGWNGGRIWRLFRDGTAVEYARGLRNPFDFVWDAGGRRLIVPDNGEVGREDELDVVAKGEDCGWPLAFGRDPHPAGTTPPVYVWDEAIVPTGALALSGANDQLRYGVVVTGFYSKALHYVPEIDARPLPAPIIVVDAVADLIDVAQGPDGTVYLGGSRAIFKLVTPKRGDCDGDGTIAAADLAALARELGDAPSSRIKAQDGAYRGSWGCDANGDDRIDAADLPQLASMLTSRRRAVAR